MLSLTSLKETFLELVGIDSESRNERRVCDFIKSRLSPWSSGIIEDSAGVKIGGNCGNLYITIEGNSSQAPVIMLNAHMDTVKPGNGIQPIIEGDLIRTDGNTILGADDKAGISVILEAVRILKEENRRHGNLLLLFTVSEETGLLGARHVDFSLLKADFGLSLDCSGAAGIVYNASPSHDTLRAVIRGRAAHAGMEPEKGISAIRVAASAISMMNLGRIDAETTANVGIIRGGLATNIIPDTVTIDAEARSHDSEKLDAQIASMKEAVEKAAHDAGAESDIEIIREYKSYRIPEDAPVVRCAMRAAEHIGVKPEIRASGGGSDANIFNAAGLPTVPIATAMKGCHTRSETLSISELGEVLKWTLAAVELSAE